MRLLPTLAVIPFLLPLAACGSGEDSPAPGPSEGSVAEGDPTPVLTGASASCALVVVVDGVRYIGSASAKVPLTDRTLEAEVPVCSDVALDGETAAPAPEPTEVQVIDGVDPADAVWFADTVMVREGAEMPASVRRLMKGSSN